MELHKIPNFMRSLVPFLVIISILLCKVYGVPPVLNYAGQVAVNGEAFDGNGIQVRLGQCGWLSVTYWSNDGASVAGSEPQSFRCCCSKRRFALHPPWKHRPARHGGD